MGQVKALTGAQRIALFRKRLKRAGKMEIRVIVYPRHAKLIKDLARQLCEEVEDGLG